LRKLPKLEFLNGLAVDRDELYSSQEVDEDLQGNLSGGEAEQHSYAQNAAS